MAKRTIRIQVAHIEQAKLDVVKLRSFAGDTGCAEAAVAIERAIRLALRREGVGRGSVTDSTDVKD